jgi:endonuclease/exonuclease/phosphatase family metal-dependent hydrolase
MSLDTKSTLRFVQFNVENLFLFLDLYKGQDFNSISEPEWRALSTSTTHNKSLRKVRGLAEVIKELNPDILMLNEVGGLESLQNFNTHFLSSAYVPYLKEGNSLRGIDVGYLLKKDLPYKPVLISHKNRPIHFLYPHESQTPAGGKSHYFSRDVAELRLFEAGETSPRYVVLLTHLKSKLDADRIDAEGRLRRGAELKALVDLYNEIQHEVGPQTPILVCGDLNGVASRHGTEEEFRYLHEKSDLLEALEVAETPLEERFTQVQISHSGKQQLVQIDYVLFSPNLREKVLPKETFVYRFKDPNGQRAPIPRHIDERNIHPSDHYPVVVTIRK